MSWAWLGPIGRPGHSILLPSLGYDRETAVCHGCGGLVMHIFTIAERGDKSFVGDYKEASYVLHEHWKGGSLGPFWLHVDTAEQEACFLTGHITAGAKI